MGGETETPHYNTLRLKLGRKTLGGSSAANCKPSRAEINPSSVVTARYRSNGLPRQPSLSSPPLSPAALSAHPCGFFPSPSPAIGLGDHQSSPHHYSARCFRGATGKCWRGRRWPTPFFPAPGAHGSLCDALSRGVEIRGSTVGGPGEERRREEKRRQEKGARFFFFPPPRMTDW